MAGNTAPEHGPWRDRVQGFTREYGEVQTIVRSRIASGTAAEDQDPRDTAIQGSAHMVHRPHDKTRLTRSAIVRCMNSRHGATHSACQGTACQSPALSVADFIVEGHDRPVSAASTLSVHRQGRLVQQGCLFA